MPSALSIATTIWTSGAQLRVPYSLPTTTTVCLTQATVHVLLLASQTLPPRGAPSVSFPTSLRSNLLPPVSSEDYKAPQHTSRTTSSTSRSTAWPSRFGPAIATTVSRSAENRTPCRTSRTTLIDRLSLEPPRSQAQAKTNHHSARRAPRQPVAALPCRPHSRPRTKTKYPQHASRTTSIIRRSHGFKRWSCTLGAGSREQDGDADRSWRRDKASNREVEERRGAGLRRAGGRKSGYKQREKHRSRSSGLTEKSWRQSWP
ncbi:hypothetical protein BKA63DRAFT_307633 [Paraphoma chrysanthemicola]|nr:hypothetical protein BKA63DRAFT_307633 [Paraphoma chrysanthemicola]